VGHAAGGTGVTARELQPFNPRTLLALIALGAVAFIAMTYFMIAGEIGRPQRPASPTTTSRSAIGYRAFIELLRRFDLSVVAPTSVQLERASLRIVLAPGTPDEVHAALGSRPVLIVLPKWRASARPLSDSVTDAHLLETAVVRDLAWQIAGDISIVRPDSTGAWRDDGVQGEPTLAHPQLMRSRSLCPVVSNDAGMLIARLCSQPNIAVLADPDLLANHGLWRGDNAVLAMSAVASLRKGNGPIVALERVTELPPSRSIWRLAFSPPFVLITVTALVAVGVAVWFAAMRFGPAAAEELDRPPGVMTLIDIAARLLRPKVDGGRLLGRYADLLTLDLGRRLHAPQRLRGASEIGAWLDASERGREAGSRYADLARGVASAGEKRLGAAAAVMAAARLHHWRGEMLNGR
jgi:hypothetical protein